MHFTLEAKESIGRFVKTELDASLTRQICEILLCSCQQHVAYGFSFLFLYEKLIYVTPLRNDVHNAHRSVCDNLTIM